jgi:hypothetical protein
MINKKKFTNYTLVVKALVVLMACVLCIPIAHAAACKQIQLSVCNNTDQDLVIAAHYTVLKPKDPALLGMPNPFVFVEAPAHETTYAHFNRVGGGRLGKLEEVVIRTRNEDGPLDLKTLSAKELRSTNSEDMLMVTIDKDALP